MAGHLLLAPAASGGGLAIEALPGCSFGAVVRGVSLLTNDDLDDPETWRKVYAAFLEHALLIFPGQVGLTSDAHDAFTRRFGRLDHRVSITNARRDGTLRDVQGNTTEGWHTDLSFAPVSLKAGTLYAEKVEMTWGGQTGFADMRAGYDALDEPTKQRIENLLSYNAIEYPMLRRAGIDQSITKGPKDPNSATGWTSTGRSPTCGRW